MLIARRLVLLLICCLILGCGEDPGTVLPRSQSVPLNIPSSQSYIPETTWIVSDWFPSQDEKVAVRVTIQSAAGDPDSYRLTIGIENRSPEPLDVIKPALQWYWSAIEEVSLTGPDGECKYIGPVPSEPALDQNSIVTLAPGEQTGGSFHLHFSNYESADQDGLYKVQYRYTPGPPDQVDALRRQYPSLWYEEIQTGNLTFYRGDDPPPTEFDRNVTISFPVKEYTYSLKEVAAGVSMQYEIEVAQDFSGTATPLDMGGVLGAGQSGLAPFYRIYGDSHTYSLLDVGLAPEPDFSTHPISTGNYEFEFTWDGTNWTGPSDTDTPKGPPFPPGEYVLEVRIAGFVDLPEGRRAYDLRNQVPVILTE